MGAFDCAFLNDAQARVANSLPVRDVDASDCDAVYFVGGKGAMFDFPHDPAMQAIVRDAFESGKGGAAVCHGPDAFVGVTLSDGQPLLAGRSVSGFTNEEELFLIPDAAAVFPFMLGDGLAGDGGAVSRGPMYLDHVVRAGTLITGQNPWSVWTMAEQVVEALGYTPVAHARTPEENAVAVLARYEEQGEGAAGRCSTPSSARSPRVWTGGSSRCTRSSRPGRGAGESGRLGRRAPRAEAERRVRT